MSTRRLMLNLAAAIAYLAFAACSLIRHAPIVGGPSNLQTDAVRSIKSVTVRRVAVMPILEAPDKIDKVMAEGAGEAITAELYSEVSLVGGWQVVPESDVAHAMQKLPPATVGNQQADALALGREVSADAVLYGTIERYRERVGVDYAAATPAAVSFTLHLLDLKSGQVVWTAKFAKSQKALTENVLNLVNFLQQAGRWVRANEIAAEGVKEAVADLRQQLALDQNVKRFETGTYEELKSGQGRY